MGFVIRWIFAFVLLAATYNPTALELCTLEHGELRRDKPVGDRAFGPDTCLMGYIIYLRATLRSIGIFGMILILGRRGHDCYGFYSIRVSSALD